MSISAVKRHAARLLCLKPSLWQPEALYWCLDDEAVLSPVRPWLYMAFCGFGFFLTGNGALLGRSRPQEQPLQGYICVGHSPVDVALLHVQAGSGGCAAAVSQPQDEQTTRSPKMEALFEAQKGMLDDRVHGNSINAGCTLSGIAPCDALHRQAHSAATKR